MIGVQTDAAGRVTVNPGGAVIIGTQGRPCCCGGGCPCDCPAHNDPNIGSTYGFIGCTTTVFDPIPRPRLFSAILRPANTGGDTVYNRVRYERNWRVSWHAIDSRYAEANLWVTYSASEKWCENYRITRSCLTYEGTISDYVVQFGNAQTRYTGSIQGAFERGLPLPWFQDLPQLRGDPLSDDPSRDYFIPHFSLSVFRISSLFRLRWGCGSFSQQTSTGFFDQTLNATDNQAGAGSLTFLYANLNTEPGEVQAFRTSLAVAWSRSVDCVNTLSGGGGSGSLTGNDCPGCGGFPTTLLA